MVLSHLFPLQIHPKDGQEVEYSIPQEGYEVEIFRSIRALVIFPENSVSKLYFVRIFTIKLQEDE